jgi:hypothetical protein
MGDKECGTIIQMLVVNELIIEHILRICHAISGLGPMAIKAEGSCVDKDQRTMGWRDMA